MQKALVSVQMMMHGGECRETDVRGQGWPAECKTHLLTHRTMTVPTAMDCAASSIHHSPLSHMLPLGSDAAPRPKH